MSVLESPPVRLVSENILSHLQKSEHTVTWLAAQVGLTVDELFDVMIRDTMTIPQMVLAARAFNIRLESLFLTGGRR